MNDLVVTNLTVKRAEREVLTDISFSVHHQKLLAIIGPNGGGKSSLLRAILGLIPSEGTIEWRVQPDTYLPSLERITRTGLPPLTVGDFMSLKGHHRADHLLTQVGLDPSFNQRAFAALSTGEFQRMLVAWSCKDHPSLVVLDEPTSGLDLEGERRIFSFLKALPNCTIILATHHIHSALEYADHIVAVNKKQLCYGAQGEITLESVKQLYADQEVGHGS